MDMTVNLIDTAMDHIMLTHWAHAVGVDPAKLFIERDCDNLFTYAKRHDVWFTPDYEPGHVIIPTPQLESFRLAYMYEQLSNLRDITVNLDDDPSGSLETLRLLSHNDPDYDGNQSWITTPNPYSLVWRTIRLRP